MKFRLIALVLLLLYSFGCVQNIYKAGEIRQATPAEIDEVADQTTIQEDLTDADDSETDETGNEYPVVDGSDNLDEDLNEDLTDDVVDTSSAIASEESVISLARVVIATNSSDDELDIQDWDYGASIEIRGKLERQARTEDEISYGYTRYKFVETTVTWSVRNEYVKTHIAPGIDTTVNAFLTTAEGSDNLENLNLSYALLEPVEVNDAGWLLIETNIDNEFEFRGEFLIPGLDQATGFDARDTMLEYHIPITGTKTDDMKLITGSEAFENYVASSGFTEMDHGTSKISPPEETPSWQIDWVLNFP